jgi:hypothetical protein
MKIVKLNGNFNIYKTHGFEVGVKFDLWDTKARNFEAVVADCLGKRAWGWKYYPSLEVRENWAGEFGKRASGQTTPYWIYFRRESMLTLVLLSINHQKD